MSSIFKGNINISIFGESHGEIIGTVIDNIPAGEKIDFDELCFQMNRRAPGCNDISSSRNESDTPKIISGLLNGYTTGAPICALIKNKDTRSQDYKKIINKTIRPGHADYTASIKYNGFNDLRGSGHFSGRLTAPLTIAGSICRQILEKRGIVIGSHIYSIFNIYDTPFEKIDDSLLKNLTHEKFPLIDSSLKEKMINKIIEIKNNGDSVGGIIECAVNNVPVGLGNPIFDSIESGISSLVFSIPAIKGIEFGAGFKSATMTGSQNNDEFTIINDKIFTKSNNHGGILGGISSGMPIIFRCAVKPTPSISKIQNTINLNSNSPDTISASGRHDPCIVPRAVPVVEAVTAIALLNFFKEKDIL